MPLSWGQVGLKLGERKRLSGRSQTGLTARKLDNIKNHCSGNTIKTSRHTVLPDSGHNKKENPNDNCTRQPADHLTASNWKRTSIHRLHREKSPRTRGKLPGTAVTVRRLVRAAHRAVSGTGDAGVAGKLAALSCGPTARPMVSPTAITASVNVWAHCGCGSAGYCNAITSSTKPGRADGVAKRRETVARPDY
ncbi:hypothetical protein [Xenorhabdus ehlersii]|uniref:hypothetical protein n=1 Tax=Xenorhabdus ehlersii TaxID=290111 RepID=UPI001FCA1D15|nr:hypothetical protein [Xenorhabdus ehlersii]